jgi:hypothetical protein
MTWLHQLALRLWEWVPYILPAFSNFILVLLGIVLSFATLTERIEKNTKYQKGLAAICLILGLVGLGYEVTERRSNDQATKTLIKDTQTAVQNTNGLVQTTTILVNKTNDVVSRLGSVELLVTALNKWADEEEKRLDVLSLSEMSTSELSERAYSLANVMRALGSLYANQDTQIDLVYYDRLEGHANEWSKQRQENWIEEEARKRSEWRAYNEPRAEKLIRSANRLRIAMLDKIDGSDKLLADEKVKSWFENPRSNKVSSFLWHLGEMADYLEGLAKRLPPSKPSQ